MEEIKSEREIDWPGTCAAPHPVADCLSISPPLRHHSIKSHKSQKNVICVSQTKAIERGRGKFWTKSESQTIRTVRDTVLLTYLWCHYSDVVPSGFFPVEHLIGCYKSSVSINGETCISTTGLVNGIPMNKRRKRVQNAAYFHCANHNTIQLTLCGTMGTENGCMKITDNKSCCISHQSQYMSTKQ